MPTAYIGIGSNLGNREQNCLDAVKLLSNEKVIIRKRSSMHETEPWGIKDQPRFMNMVIEVETGLEPGKLLKILKNIETKMGRTSTYRWGPRIIDLDLLFYNDLVIDAPDLQVPHPLMHEREFVLRPLAEIAPDKAHPVLKKTIKELLQNKPQRHGGTEN